MSFCISSLQGVVNVATIIIIHVCSEAMALQVRVIDSIYIAEAVALLSLQVDVGYTTSSKSISNYPLSAALTCAKLCGAAEEVWGVV